jgi:zeaxanthin glucosyltransferase
MPLAQYLRGKHSMKRILFAVIPEKGHINPYIGVAQHLKAQGFEVGFYSPNDISEQLKAADLDCFVGDFISPASTDVNEGKIFSDRIADAAWLRDWIKKMLIDSVPDSINSILKAIQQFSPDVLVTDPMIYASAIAANTKNTPWLVISNSLNPVLTQSIESELLQTVSWLSPFRDKLFKQHSMEIEFSGCDMISPYLTIAFATPEFVGTCRPDVKLVGPSKPKGLRGDERDFPWEKIAENVPVIYMSLGSQIYHQPKMFQVAFEAVRGQPVQLVAAIHNMNGKDIMPNIPPNVLLTNYTPQLKLLKKTSVMITHGGANSVMEAIQSNVPMLISPICNDQFHQAHFIQERKIGISLDLNHTSPEICWQIINRLLDSKEIRDNMTVVHDSYKIDGALNAANLVSKFFDRGLTN